ncbi:MAG: hypothetical protein V9E81_15560 [Marmoricola sp.]
MFANAFLADHFIKGLGSQCCLDRALIARGLRIDHAGVKELFFGG